MTSINIELPTHLQTIFSSNSRDKKVTTEQKAYAHPIICAQAPRTAVGYTIGSTACGRGLPDGFYRLHQIDAYFVNRKDARHYTDDEMVRFDQQSDLFGG